MGGTEAEAKNNLGFAYERRGDMANAYDLYLEAVRLDPSAERPRFNLVHAATVLGRPVPPGGRATSARPSGRAKTHRRERVEAMTTTKKHLALLAVVVALLSAGACGRKHLGANYAQAYNEWFTAQHVNKKSDPEAARQVIEGLDAQEASTITKSYRTATAKGGEAGGGRLLMIGPQRGGTEAYIPPPSVPSGQ